MLSGFSLLGVPFSSPEELESLSDELEDEEDDDEEDSLPDSLPFPNN